MTQLSIESGLRANYLQDEGPSRPGTDWSVVLSGVDAEERLSVRTYEDGTPRESAEEHATAVLAYLEQLLEEGWSPDEESGSRGITVPDDFVAV
jgi:hypothetical protein